MTDAPPEAVNYELLRRVFDELPLPATDEAVGLAYSSRQLPGGTSRLAKSRHGNPALIIPTGVPRDAPVRDRHYANLRLRHALSLRIEGDSEIPGTQLYSVAECVTDEPSVVDWFLRLLPAIYNRTSGASSQFEALDEEIARIGELFRLLDSSSHGELVGLWGELALLASARDIPHAVQCWRMRTESLHDFSRAGQHVEVKCTEGRQRRHIFSHRQLDPPETVTVASMLAEAMDGPSILDLYEGVLRALVGNPDLQHKLQSHVMGAVGRRLSEADDTCFDLAEVMRSVRFVPASEVPRLSEPFPIGVSNVSFASDLSNCRFYTADDELPELVATLFPQD